MNHHPHSPAAPVEPRPVRRQLLDFLQQAGGSSHSQDTLLAWMQEVQSLNRRLSDTLALVKDCPSGSALEDLYLARIQAAQDARFQLLCRIHGPRVEEYHHLTAL